MGIFLGARWRWLWVLSVTQLSDRPKGGAFPITCLSLYPPPLCQLQHTELNRRDEWKDRFQASSFLPHVACEVILLLPSLCCPETLQEVKGKGLISECLVGVVPGVRPLALPAHFGTFCKPENVARRLQSSVLLEEWRRQHFFEVSPSSSFLVCFHLI